MKEGREVNTAPCYLNHAILYTYDPLDRTASRTEKAGTSNEKTTTFQYLGLTDDVISETNDLTGEIQKSYTYSPWGERLSQIKHGSSAEQSFYSYNPHTDVEALTDESGTPVATYGYTAYGKLDDESTTGKDDPRDPNYNPDDPYNVYWFNSKRWDPHTGKVDMGFRDYDPGLNRFLTRDMYNGALEDMQLTLDPWNMNRYAFAGGNPISFVELDGHIPIIGSDTRDPVGDYIYYTGRYYTPEGPGRKASLEKMVAEHFERNPLPEFPRSPDYPTYNVLVGPGHKDGLVHPEEQQEYLFYLGNAVTFIGGELVADYLLARFLAPRILNVGAGKNPLKGAVNVDIKAGEGIQYVVDASKSLPFKSGSFDEVVSQNPYGFYPANPEITRVLKPGGLLKVVGSPKNKYFNQVYKASPEKLREMGYELVYKGNPTEEMLWGVMRYSNGDPFGLQALSTLQQVTLRKIR